MYTGWVAGHPNLRSRPIKDPFCKLRIYEMVDESQVVFHTRFRDHAWRMMKTHELGILVFGTDLGRGPPRPPIRSADWTSRRRKGQGGLQADE